MMSAMIAPVENVEFLDRIQAWKYKVTYRVRCLSRKIGVKISEFEIWSNN